MAQTNKKTYSWEFLGRFGHQYFQEKTSGLIAIADDSGSKPELTDDGVLYLDTSCPVQAGTSGFSIPLVFNNKRSSTIASSAEVRYVCEYHGMKLSVAGAVFEMVKPS